ncbi:hypothetical protein [Corynebacterium kozikiae]|uniref:hypothetical protein n=1 Tax=Corynebacterium kozikiae TaxID=2968469 RepID=UPI00211C982E|nr:hypothetical protein [Corynebacterium sp. 76QC2CO]MCQ9342170.1 hypothetical protein [Corynebacterium sp. 76QC2CO]
MQSLAATSRHRELTQELFNIGDEVAQYLENLAQAVADWDQELAEDCLVELEEIVADARLDARRIHAELAGLRTALTSGIASGSMSLESVEAPQVAPPVIMTAASLRDRFPILNTPVIVGELSQSLNARTELVEEYLLHVVDWVLAYTEYGARDLDAVRLPKLYEQAGQFAAEAVQAWIEVVAAAHGAYTRSMRGNNPPEFLAERARIAEVVARVAQKKRQTAGEYAG